MKKQVLLKKAMHRTGCLLLAMTAMMFFCAGCDSSPSVDETRGSTTPVGVVGGTEPTQGSAATQSSSTEALPAFTVDNTTPADRLITKEYSLEEMKVWLINRSPIDGYLPDIFTLHRDFPVECLRSPAPDRYYAVYRLKEGGHLTIHFMTLEPGSWDPAAPKKDVLIFTHSYGWDNKLSDADFRNLKEGMGREAVERLYGGKIPQTNWLFNDEWNWQSMHVTPEALYLIFYTGGEDDPDAVIEKIIRSEDFQYSIPINDSFEWVYDFHLVDVDY